MHNIIPQTVGSKKERKVHFKLPVSFFIVKSVVPHGKCKSVNISTFIPVSNVHPFAIKISVILLRSSNSTNGPCPM